MGLALGDTTRLVSNLVKAYAVAPFDGEAALHAVEEANRAANRALLVLVEPDRRPNRVAWAMQTMAGLTEAVILLFRDARVATPALTAFRNHARILIGGRLSIDRVLVALGPQGDYDDVLTQGADRLEQHLFGAANEIRDRIAELEFESDLRRDGFRGDKRPRMAADERGANGPGAGPHRGGITGTALPVTLSEDDIARLKTSNCCFQYVRAIVDGRTPCSEGSHKVPRVHQLPQWLIDRFPAVLRPLQQRGM